jgi:hypothetical protein
VGEKSFLCHISGNCSLLNSWNREDRKVQRQQVNTYSKELEKTTTLLLLLLQRRMEKQEKSVLCNSSSLKPETNHNTRIATKTPPDLLTDLMEMIMAMTANLRPILRQRNGKHMSLRNSSQQKRREKEKKEWRGGVPYHRRRTVFLFPFTFVVVTTSQAYRRRPRLSCVSPYFYHFVIVCQPVSYSLGCICVLWTDNHCVFLFFISYCKQIKDCTGR